MAQNEDKRATALNTAISALDAAVKAVDQFRREETMHWLGNTAEALELLWSLAPFRAGSMVRLLEVPDFDLVAPGWRGYRDVLVVGAIGTVRDVGANRRGFTACVTFGNVSAGFWIGANKLEVVHEAKTERRAGGK